MRKSYVFKRQYIGFHLLLLFRLHNSHRYAYTRRREASAGCLICTRQYGDSGRIRREPTCRINFRDTKRSQCSHSTSFLRINLFFILSLLCLLFLWHLPLPLHLLPIIVWETGVSPSSKVAHAIPSFTYTTLMNTMHLSNHLVLGGNGLVRPMAAIRAAGFSVLRVHADTPTKWKTIYLKFIHLRQLIYP